jgi:TonB family protein
MLVHDAFGSFVIHKRPEGRGAGDDGGALTPGLPAPNRQNHARSDARAGRKPNLALSWSQFEQAFGEEKLQAQREQYVEQRRSAAQGGGRRERWKKFRGAIENFLPNVQPGTQTALNAAASPFASYLAAIHRNIHREFAHSFLAGLPLAGGPFSDRTLNTTLEIVLNGDGSVHQVGVVKTSGFMPFDYGAFDAVMRAAPYPPAPRSILSGDGRVYVHWGFYRNERQCGTFNARPFILPHPGETPAPGETPLHDEGEDSAPRGPVFDGDEGELGAAPRPRVLRHDG